MSDQPSELSRAFDFQIAACESLGSPFSAAVLRIVAADIAAGGPFADLVRALGAIGRRASSSPVRPPCACSAVCTIWC